MKNVNISSDDEVPEGQTVSSPEANEKKTFPPKKFLITGVYSMAGDLGWQLLKEGHEVKMYGQDKGSSDIADGFVEKVDSWEKYIDWADVIIFDDVGFGEVADRLRAKGKLVIGGSSYTDKIETDREFGQSELKSAGLPILPHWEFNSFDAAIQFIKEHPMRLVFKPSGDEVLDWYLKSLLFLGQEEDGTDILDLLEHNKKSWSAIKSFQLQKFVAGVEVAVSAFFNGHDFIYPINVNFEHKKLFPGDLGPFTGEMGTLMYWDNSNNLFRATLGKMRDKLAESKYVGAIDVNCIVNGKGIYPLEFTSRFGYPTISIMMEGVQSPWGEFLYSIAKGEDYKLKTKRGFQIGVVIVVPPFPYHNAKEFEMYKNTSIVFRKPNLNGVHLGDVKRDGDEWKPAGEDGYVLVVTGSNHTVEGARKEVYHRIDNILLLNKYYRTDIGEKWTRESDELWTWDIL